MTATRKRRDCPTHQRKSLNRSNTLRGRKNPNKGQAQFLPRQAKTVGLTPRPKPDPTLKPWPSDVVLIVASTPATVNVRGIRGRMTDQHCADCDARLALDSWTIEVALAMPERQRRPLKFICVKCCLKYDRQSIEHLTDIRTTRGTNEGNSLDE